MNMKRMVIATVVVAAAFGARAADELASYTLGVTSDDRGDYLYKHAGPSRMVGIIVARGKENPTENDGVGCLRRFYRAILLKLGKTDLGNWGLISQVGESWVSKSPSWE